MCRQGLDIHDTICRRQGYLCSAMGGLWARCGENTTLKGGGAHEGAPGQDKNLSWQIYTVLAPGHKALQSVTFTDVLGSSLVGGLKKSSLTRE